MKTISLADNPGDIASIFTSFIVDNDPLISWQLQEKGRLVKTSKVHSFNPEANEFLMEVTSDEKGSFDIDMVYFFIKNKNIIFKSLLIQNSDLLKFKVPNELKVLDDEETSEWIEKINFEDLNVFVKGYGFANVPLDTTRVRGEGRANEKTQSVKFYSGKNSTDTINTRWKISHMSKKDSELFEQELSFVTLDEEDKLFADQRAAPRARPPKDKMVCIQFGDKSVGEMYSLFDLSQGGLGFITENPERFEVDQTLNILGFDNNGFETPMVVVVRAIRETDSTGSQFKVGCAFQA